MSDESGSQRTQLSGVKLTIFVEVTNFLKLKTIRLA